MTTSDSMIKYTLAGDIAGGQTWSIGFWVRPVVTGSPAAANLDTILGNMATPLANFWNGFKTKNAATLRYTSNNAYYYPAGSPVSTLVSHVALSPAPGTGTQYTSPRQALVISLHTGASGRTRRGRMYVPYTAENSGSNLQAPSSTCDAFANLANSFRVAIPGVSTDTVFGGQSWVVRSNKAGVGYDITSVSCDSKVDTQRRREDKIAAAYSKTLP